MQRENLIKRTIMRYKVKHSALEDYREQTTNNALENK